MAGKINYLILITDLLPVLEIFGTKNNECLTLCSHLHASLNKLLYHCIAVYYLCLWVSPSCLGIVYNSHWYNNTFITFSYFCLQIFLPDSVTGRYHHTVSSFVLDPNHVLLIIVGGNVKSEEVDRGKGVKERVNKPVTYPNITMVVELGNNFIIIL